MLDFIWAHILFPLITTDHDHLGGGVLRENRICMTISKLWMRIG